MSMKKVVVLAFLLLGLSALASADAVGVNVYTGHSFTDGSPFSGYVGSTSLHPSNGNPCGTGCNFSYFDAGSEQAGDSLNWHPFGQGDFGATVTGTLSVAQNDFINFYLESDDGSAWYVDGVLVVDNSGAHGPNGVFGSEFLTAGNHSFQINFFECCGGPSELFAE